MEPRRRRRGNHGGTSTATGRERLLQWSRGVAAAETGAGRDGHSRRALGFNGAAASPPRKPSLIIVPMEVSINASMEPRRRRRGNRCGPPRDSPGRPSFNGAAASPPRKPRRSRCDRRRSSCFNGAAASPPRKPQCDMVGRVAIYPASMEPRRRRRGNRGHSESRTLRAVRFNGAAASPPRKPHSIFTVHVGRVKLQWSRGVAAAETPI